MKTPIFLSQSNLSQFSPNLTTFFFYHHWSIYLSSDVWVVYSFFEHFMNIYILWTLLCWSLKFLQVEIKAIITLMVGVLQDLLGFRIRLQDSGFEVEASSQVESMNVDQMGRKKRRQSDRRGEPRDHGAWNVCSLGTRFKTEKTKLQNCLGTLPNLRKGLCKWEAMKLKLHSLHTKATSSERRCQRDRWGPDLVGSQGP